MTSFKILKGLEEKLPAQLVEGKMYFCTDTGNLYVDCINEENTLERKLVNKDSLDNKQATITGGATTITNSNLTKSRALISNSSGKVAASAVTSTELGYLNGVTSKIQTQLNNKLSMSGGKSITFGDDLNNYKTVGVYQCSNSDTAVNVLNAPQTNSGFKLIVMEGYSNTKTSQFVTTNDCEFYYRHYNGSTWTDWAHFYDMDEAIDSIQEQLDSHSLNKGEDNILEDPAPLNFGDTFTAITDTTVDGHTVTDNITTYTLPSDRLFTTLVPTGTEIATPGTDLKSITYLKVGRYYCSKNDTAKTLKNCPTDLAFMMEVYSPLSTTIDNETTTQYVCRLRKITEYKTGVQYIQYVGSGATKGAFTYDDWYVVPRAKFVLDSSDKNDGNATVGSEIKPVYVDEDGTITACEYKLEKDVPSDAKFTDTTYTFDGAVSTIKDSDLSVNKALISNYAGKVAVSEVKSEELNCLKGVTSNIQEQLDDKQEQLDDKADVGHAHNYAGSSSVGGPADSAEKLNTDAGSPTQPVYFVNGVPVNTTYTLEKSVPDDAKFTDTTYDNATTTADGLMSAEDKIKLNSTNIAYGTCSTAAATAAKVITINGNTNWTLTPGSTISIKFNNTNTANNPTFNINGTGAKRVSYTGSVITTSNLSFAGASGIIMTYMYDGTNYVLVSKSRDLDTQVTQTVSTTNGNFPILLRGTSAGTSTTTTTTSFGKNITANPSTSTLSAETFKGNLSSKTASTKLDITSGTTISISSGETASIIFKKDDVEHARFNPDGHLLPESDGEYNIGSTDAAWNKIYAKTFTGDLSGNANTATNATNDASGNIITSTYETKIDANTKLEAAKTYADTAVSTAAKALKDELLNGAGGAYDTLKELGDLIDDNTDAIDALEIVASGKQDKINLTANKALISDGAGNVVTSDITSTELGRLSGIDDNIQTQLDAKANKTDIATTKYVGLTSESVTYAKISDFGAWGTGAWYQKGFSMLLTSRAGETIWFSLSANDSNTSAKAFRIMNTYSKINSVYYSVAESAVYTKMSAWCNNLSAHILSNIYGDYVPTVAQATALPNDAVEVPIVEFGPAYDGLVVGDTSVALLLGGSADRPTYNSNDLALKSDIPTTYAGSSTAGGAATSAIKLATARTIGLSGDVSGSASFDGSGNVTISTTVADDSHNHVIANIDNLQSTLNSKVSKAGDTMTGNLTIGNGRDLTLQASSGSEDSGDLIYANGSGAEIGRLWMSEGALHFRNGANAAIADVLHTQNYTSYLNGTYVNASGDTMTGNLTAPKFIASQGLAVTQTDGTSGYGISLYGSTTPQTYGLWFGKTSTYGTHGSVTSDWATYFGMNSGATTRGWVFRREDECVASISGAGNLTLNGSAKIGNAVTMAYDSANECLNFIF